MHHPFKSILRASVANEMYLTDSVREMQKGISEINEEKPLSINEKRFCQDVSRVPSRRRAPTVSWRSSRQSPQSGRIDAEARQSHDRAARTFLRNHRTSPKIHSADREDRLL